MTIPLERKLATFDRYAERAVNAIIARLATDRGSLIALARERHVAGHALYGDGYLFEYDFDRLGAEMAEEIADAIVYEVRRRDLADK